MKTKAVKNKRYLKMVVVSTKFLTFWNQPFYSDKLMLTLIQNRKDIESLENQECPYSDSYSVFTTRLRQFEKCVTYCKSYSTSL